MSAAASAPLFPQSDPRPDALQKYRDGRNFESVGRLQDAEANYNEAVRICQSEIDQRIATSDSYAVLGWTLQRQKKYRDVIAWGERGLRLYPDDVRLNEIMGEAYFYLDNYERSLAEMQRYVSVIANRDRASTAYFFIGEIFRLQGKFRRSDIAYSTAVRLEPGVALWWYRLALARESAREYAAAIEAYERALRINPEYPEATEGVTRSKARINS